MSNRKLVRELGMSDSDADARAADILAHDPQKEIEKKYEDSVKNFTVDTIIRGKVLEVVGDDILVDIGYKSEGAVPKTDFLFNEKIVPGAEIEVFLETIEDESGMIALSKQKAD